MKDIFRKTASTLANEAVARFKSEGRPVIGYPCTYVPEEIIHALGGLPFRLRGVGISSLSIGDTYFGPVICSFPKCVLQLAGEGQYAFLDGVIMSNGCDSMRRLDECWRKADDDIPGTSPGFFHYFGVPHKDTTYSRDWFAEEIRGLIEALEGHFGLTLTKEALGESIRLYNEGRMLLRRLDALRAREKAPLSGEEALSVIIAGSSLPREEYNRLLTELLVEMEAAPDGIDGRKRLLLVGSINDDLDFVRVIEECGALVAADTLCFGARAYRDLVPADGDPIEALAGRYLSHAYCPRMFGHYRERLALLMDTVREFRIDGVILQNIRFCDLHGSENGIFQRDLEREGIPCLRMEREYGPLVESGRIRMRVDAFLEKL